MFEITYRGGNSVVITTKSDELYIDPNQSNNGLKIPNIKNDVQLATEKRFLVDSEELDRPALEGPGEYEIGPFAIVGFETAHHVDNDNTMKASAYRIVVNDIAIALLGNIKAELNEDQLEMLGLIDILILPVGGGGYTLDGKEAAALVRKIEPRVIIPVHYRHTGISYEVPQDDETEFVTEMGLKPETVNKFKVKSINDIPTTLTIYKLEKS